MKNNRSKNYLIKRTVASAVLGALFVSSAMSFQSLCQSGKFELVKDHESKIKKHLLLETVVKNDEIKTVKHYVSNYDLSMNDRKDNVTIYSLWGVDNNKIKIQNDVFTNNSISFGEVVSLIKNMDVHDLEYAKNFKSMLLAQDFKLSDTNYTYMNVSDYETKYADNGSNYDMAYYLYDHNYDDTVLANLNDDEIDVYNKSAATIVLGGSLVGATLGASLALLSSNKSKKKIYKKNRF